MNRILTIYLILLGLTACTTIISTEREAHKFSKTDLELVKYLNYFNNLAKDRGIIFKNDVFVGFEDIKIGKTSTFQTIGFCRTGFTGKQVSIDRIWWLYAGEGKRMSLILHELAHCKCGREHDYGENLPYPEQINLESNHTGILGPIRAFFDELFGDTEQYGGNIFDAFFEDSCPKSLMYPIVVDSVCYLTHYNDYISELFNRCKPY